MVVIVACARIGFSRDIPPERLYSIAANLLLANVGAPAQAVVTAQANVNIALTKLQETVAKYGEAASQSLSAQAAYQRAQDDLSATQRSGVAAQAEMAALLTQIETAYTTEQLAALGALQLTQADLRAWAAANGQI